MFKTCRGRMAATKSHLVLRNITLVHNHLKTWAYLSSKFHSSITCGSLIITTPFCRKNDNKKKKTN